MKIVLFIFMLLLSIEYSYSQGSIYLNVDSLAQSQAKQLLNNSAIKNIIILQSGCVGYKLLSKYDCGCEEDGAAYIIWKKAGKYYSKQIGCCVKDDIREFNNSKLYEVLIENNKIVFCSKFNYHYEEIHHDFDKLTSVSARVKQEKYMEGFLFAKENKFRKFNLMQPAKIYIDSLNVYLNKK